MSRGWKWQKHSHRTYSSACKKYATEHKKLIEQLEEYRKKRIISTYDGKY